MRFRRGPATVTGESVPTLGHEAGGPSGAGRPGTGVDPGARRLRRRPCHLRAWTPGERTARDLPVRRRRRHGRPAPRAAAQRRLARHRRRAGARREGHRQVDRGPRARRAAAAGRRRRRLPVRLRPGRARPRLPGRPARPPAPRRGTRPARLVELPVGATEDRVVGALDLERALTEGVKAYEPGLLAAAHRGVLYVDEVNLLHDHLVDLLLDAAAMGRAYVEREGVSVRHAARFLLVGTMNPEEGELRPQLLDRFGLTVEVAAPRDPAERAEVVRRRLAYEADPAGFAARVGRRRAGAGRAGSPTARARLPRGRAGRRGAAPDRRGLRRRSTSTGCAPTSSWPAPRVALAAWRGRDEVTDGRRPGRRPAGAAAPPPAQPLRRPRPRRGHASTQALDDAARPRTTAPTGRRPRTAARPPPAAAPTPATAPDDDAAPTPTADADGSRGDRDPASGRRPAPAARPAPRPAPADPFRTRRARRCPASAPGARRPALARRAPSAAAWSAPAARAGTRHPAAPAGHACSPPRRTSSPAAARGPALRARAATTCAQAVREGREGNLVLFVVDASGSMAAAAADGRGQGRGRCRCCCDAYQRRDKVGLVTFRGAGAELALPPTSSVEVGRAPGCASCPPAGARRWPPACCAAARGPARRAAARPAPPAAARRRHRRPGHRAARDPVGAHAAAGLLAATGRGERGRRLRVRAGPARAWPAPLGAHLGARTAARWRSWPPTALAGHASADARRAA